MPALVLDKDVLHRQLSSVASAIPLIDRLWGTLAAIPKRSRLLVHMRECFTDVGHRGDDVVDRNYDTDLAEKVWHFDRALQTAYRWCGSDFVNGYLWRPITENNGRKGIIDTLFSPFDPENTDPNFIEPLGELSSLEREIRAAGGAVTEFQRKTIMEKLHALSAWLKSQEQTLRDGFSRFDVFARSEIAWLRDTFLRDNDSYRKVTELYDWMMKDLQTFIAVQTRLIEQAEAVQLPAIDLFETWNTLIVMVTDVASHIAAAELADVGSILQRIDIGFSLQVWPVLCSIAGELRPRGPLAEYPPPPEFVQLMPGPD